MSAFAQAGAIIGRYRVEQVLGRGGMGIVVGAVHVELGQRVALKVLKDECAADPEIVERLLREARATAALKTDHVVRVIDVARLPNNVPYIVMEYLEGRDAAALLASGPLPIEEAVGIVAQACEGLAEAHAAGIVHRDVKPQNLFISRQNDGHAHVKILDFGIARDVRGGSTLTQTATVIGSPPYMAPEQMIAAPVDARTDVWSIGATLYELLTGQVPFPGATMPEIYARIVAGPARAPIELRADLPQALSDVVMRCLSRNSRERPSDAAALAKELAPFAPAAIAMSALRLAPIAWGTTKRAPAISTRSARPAIAIGSVAVAIALSAYFWPRSRAQTVVRVPPPIVSSVQTASAFAPGVPVESLPQPSVAPPRPLQKISPRAHPSTSAAPSASVDPYSTRTW